MKSRDQASLNRAANRLAKIDRHLGDILERLGPPPLWKRPATFATLVRIILEQQVSLTSAKATFERLSDACDSPVTAAAVAKLSEHRLRELGITRQKARYIFSLSGDVVEGRFRIGRLRHQTDDEVRANITSRIGLGHWSADIFLLLALGRPDILPVGDLALVTGMKELDGGDYSTSHKVQRRAERWKPYRSIATRIIWQNYLDHRGRL